MIIWYKGQKEQNPNQACLNESQDIKQISGGDNMNPQAIMQFMGAINTFKSNHPKFASFMERYMKSGLPEGSVIEITVTEPGEEPVTTNMKVLASDLELIQSLKDFRG